MNDQRHRYYDYGSPGRLHQPMLIVGHLSGRLGGVLRRAVWELANLSWRQIRRCEFPETIPRVVDEAVITPRSSAPSLLFPCLPKL
jgi:hypothetical protein